MTVAPGSAGLWRCPLRVSPPPRGRQFAGGDEENNLAGSVQRVGLLAVNTSSGEWISTEDKVKRFRFKANLEQSGFSVVSSPSGQPSLT